MTLKRKSQGQGHRERSQLRRSHQGLLTSKVSSLYWLMWPRTNLNAKVNQNYLVTLNRKSQGQGHRERSQLRRSHQGLFQCKVSSLYWLMWLRTNLNAEVNQNCKVTLKRKSQGQGCRERSQLRRSHQGLFPCKVSSLYWLIWPRTNLNAEVNQNVDGQTDGRTDGQTDRRTDIINP